MSGVQEHFEARRKETIVMKKAYIDREKDVSAEILTVNLLNI